MVAETAPIPPFDITLSFLSHPLALHHGAPTCSNRHQLGMTQPVCVFDCIYPYNHCHRNPRIQSSRRPNPSPSSIAVRDRIGTFNDESSNLKCKGTPHSPCKYLFFEGADRECRRSSLWLIVRCSSTLCLRSLLEISSCATALNVCQLTAERRQFRRATDWTQSFRATNFASRFAIDSVSGMPSRWSALNELTKWRECSSTST